MNLRKFINTEIKNGYNEYCYYESGKTPPSEYENLSGLELQYFEDGYIIYKMKNMDKEFQTKTYIFYNNELSLHITNYWDTKETKYDFYINDKISKTVYYHFEMKTSHTEFDINGKNIMRVEYPQSQSDRLVGFVYKNGVKTPMGLIELEKYL